MLTLSLSLAGSMVALAMFVRFRHRADPAAEQMGVTLSREEAIRLAARASSELARVDVTGWRAAAGLWSDDETIHFLHSEDFLDALRPRLQRWGLLTSWRVRFIGTRGTVLVGLGEYGDIITLEVDDAVPSSAAPGSSAPLPERLARGVDGSVWREAKFTGEGRLLDREGVAEEITWWRVDAGALGVRRGVRLRGGAVREVRLDPQHPASPELSTASEARQLIAESGSLLSAVLSLVGGICILVFSDVDGDWRYAAGLVGALLLALVLIERRGFDSSVVASYDAGLTWRQARAVAWLSAALSGLVMLTVVGLSGVAGAALAEIERVPLLADSVGQLAWGLLTGMVWLGARTWLQALGREKGWLRAAPELSDDARQAAGQGWTQALSLSLQSAIGEETVFRLLGVSLLLWLTESALLAIGVTSVLWAAAHVDADLRPRWARPLELSLVGVALGILLVQVGFLAVLVAHFAHNLTLLAAPLLVTRVRRRSTPRDGQPEQKLPPPRSAVNRADRDAAAV